MSIYDYSAILENGEEYSLEAYKDKVIIIVNTATKCGLASQFKELEDIYTTYKDRGLIVLGFPSNQFKQEVSSASEASQACQLKYGVTFPMHELCMVNGHSALPLFKYLKTTSNGILGNSIKWNFTKFLISQDGEVFNRYSPKDSPKKMLKDIDYLLNQS